MFYSFRADIAAFCDSGGRLSGAAARRTLSLNSKPTRQKAKGSFLFYCICLLSRVLLSVNVSFQIAVSKKFN